MKLQGINLIIIAVFIGAAISSCESNSKENVPLPEVVGTEIEKPSSNSKSMVVAMIDADTIFKNYEYASKLTDDLTAQSLKYKNLLLQKESELRSDLQRLQAEAASLSQFEGQTRERKLYEEQEKLQLKQEEYTRKLMELEQQYNRDIDAAINDFLERYCADKPYEMVLSNTELGVIRWADKSLDITTEVLTGLNAEYQEKVKGVESETK